MAEDIEGVFNAVDNMSATIEKISQVLDKLARQTDDVEVSMNEMSAATAGTKAAAESAESSFEEFKRTLGAVEREMGTLTRSQIANISAATTQAGANRIAAEMIDDLGDEALTTAGQMGVLDTVMGELGVQSENLSVNIGAFNLSLRNLAPLVPIAAGMGTIVSIAGAFVTAIGEATVALAGFTAGGAIAFLDDLQEEFEGITSRAESLEALLQGIRDLFIEAIDPLINADTQQFFVNLVEGLADMTNRLAQAINQMQDMFMEFFSEIADITRNNFDDVATAVRDSFDEMEPVLTDLFRWFMNKLPDALRFMSSITTELQEPLGRLGDSLLEILTSIIRLTNEIINGLGPALATALQLASALVDILTILGDGILQAAVFVGTISVVTSKFVGIADILANTLLTATNSIKQFGLAITGSGSVIGLMNDRLQENFEHLNALGKVLVNVMTLEQAAGQRHKDLADALHTLSNAVQNVTRNLDATEEEFMSLLLAGELSEEKMNDLVDELENVSDVAISELEFVPDQMEEIADEIEDATDEAEDFNDEMDDVDSISVGSAAPVKDQDAINDILSDSDSFDVDAGDDVAEAGAAAGGISAGQSRTKSIVEGVRSRERITPTIEEVSLGERLGPERPITRPPLGPGKGTAKVGEALEAGAMMSILQEGISLDAVPGKSGPGTPNLTQTLSDSFGLATEKSSAPALPSPGGSGGAPLPVLRDPVLRENKDLPAVPVDHPPLTPKIEGLKQRMKSFGETAETVGGNVETVFTRMGKGFAGFSNIVASRARGAVAGSMQFASEVYQLASFKMAASNNAVITSLHNLMASTKQMIVTSRAAAIAQSLWASINVGALVPSFIAAGTAFNVAFAGIPALLAAIVGISAAFVGVIGNMDGISSSLKGTFDGLKNAVSRIGNALMKSAVPAWNLFIDIIELLLAPFFAIWDGIKGIAGAFGLMNDSAGESGGIISSLISAFSTLQGLVGGFIEFIQPAFDMFGDILYTSFIIPFKIIEGMISVNIAMAQALVNKLMQFGVVQKMVEGVAFWFGKMKDGVAALPGIVEWVAGKIVDSFTPVVNTINAAIEATNKLTGSNISKVDFGGADRLDAAKTSASDVRSNLDDQKEEQDKDDVTTEPDVDLSLEESTENNVEVDANPEDKAQINRIVKDALEEANSFERRQQGGQ